MQTRSLGELAALLRECGLLEGIHGSDALVVRGVAHDSRKVEPGDLFLAWQGSVVDGHDYLPEARRRGALAAVVERPSESPLMPELRVKDGRGAAAILAHELFGRPSDDLFMTAVTGTNGKTTVACLIRHLFQRRGPAASLGTLGLVGSDGKPVPGTGGLTTPGPVEIARRLSGLRDQGIKTVSLEASSHALEQKRLDGLSMDVACFTNLTLDHLDYHGTPEAYRTAKAHLLTLLRDSESGVVLNGDDEAWDALPAIPARLLVTRVGDRRSSPPASEERLPDLRASQPRFSGTGTEFHMGWGEQRMEVRTPLLGAFNVENALMAVGAGLMAGISLEEAAHGLRDALPPPGRLEIATTTPVPVILDYAHTPDALARALRVLRPLYPGRVIVVFGAGGDRDRSKRPRMGRVAAELADIPIVTSDNPRTEDPERIIDEIVSGMGAGSWHRVTDRREAIRLALELARPDDVVLLAGKGHESYQIRGTEKRDFDERVVLREILDREAGS